MPPGKYGMQEEWEKEGDHRIVMDFLLPTGIFLKFPVSRNDTIKSIKKVRPPLTATPETELFFEATVL